MSRPRKQRCIQANPRSRFFKPQGIPMMDLEVISLKTDEIEALRLADLDGLYQVEAAGLMGISRATFANIIESARKKTARALLGGFAISMEVSITHKENL